ncbi:MAG: hypothetical protein U1E54_01035 [Candidatus Levybacteria bacterium]|nr:hypothetical protein [Candidatus Levybacteria bacterium]
MNKKVIFFVILFLSLGIYYAFATQFTFRPIWKLDYFNPLAQSLLHFRLDIPNPGSTYDLLQYQEKWYTRFGPLSALFLIPFQIIKGRYIPITYISVLFASLTVCLFYLLILRIKKDFLPRMTLFDVLCLVTLFAFGTSQFYVGTLTSVWHVDQIISSFFGILGIYIIFKKNPRNIDYFLSVFFISLTFLGRITVAGLLVLPFFLYFYNNGIRSIKKIFILLGIPIIISISLLFAFNYARFNNIFEYGYKYIHEDPDLEQIRKQNGVISLKNVPTNAWYMFLEFPKFSFDPKIHFDINLKGNSIFFLTPAFLTVFLANPFIKKKRKILINPFIMGSLITVAIMLFSILLYYSTGWMQFGYRYSLDFTIPLLILCMFGIKGKVNIFFAISIIISIILYILGIISLW